MIWLLVGAIPLLLIVVVGIGFMVWDDPRAFFISIFVTSLLVGCIAAIVHGLDQLGVK